MYRIEGITQGRRASLCWRNGSISGDTMLYAIYVSRYVEGEELEFALPKMRSCFDQILSEGEL